jgi:hypothetical protein
MHAIKRALGEGGGASRGHFVAETDGGRRCQESMCGRRRGQLDDCRDCWLRTRAGSHVRSNVTARATTSMQFVQLTGSFCVHVDGCGLEQPSEVCWLEKVLVLVLVLVGY